MNTLGKKLALCMGVALAFAHQSASATGLSGACYDYASTEASSAIGYDSQSVGILLANNFLTAALGSNDAFSTAAKIYPFIYSAVKGGIKEETTPGADPLLVGCLEQLDYRITDLETDYLTTELEELEAEVGAIKQNIATEGNYAYHDDAANFLHKIAIKIRNKIIDKLDDGITTAEYAEMNTKLIPGFIATIQMELLHRNEWNRYCHRNGVSSYWKDLDRFEFVSPLLLDDIVNGSLFVNDYLIDPEGFINECNDGLDTYETFNRIKNINAFNSYNKALDYIGIKVIENSDIPGLINATFDFENSKLGEQRAAFVTECAYEGRDWYSYTDTLTGNEVRTLGENRCEQLRDNLIEDALSSSIYSAEPEMKRSFRNLTFMVDSWDWQNHHIDAQRASLDVELTEFYNKTSFPLYSGVRLKYVPSNYCLDWRYTMDTAVYCDSQANDFMIRPFGGGYTITRIWDNGHFADDGGDSKYSVTTLDNENEQTVWKFRKASILDAYHEIYNEKTGRCLVGGKDSVITVQECDGTQLWHINGVSVPDHGPFVSLRHAPEDVCLVPGSGEVNCDIDALVYEVVKYNGGYRITSHTDNKNLKDRGGNDIAFYSGLGDSATWDLLDQDKNGIFRLINRDTEQCLAYDNSSLVSIECVFDSDQVEFWSLETMVLPTALSGSLIKLSPDGLSEFGGCISDYVGNSPGTQSPAGYSHYGCRMAVKNHNGGYLIVDTDTGKENFYIADWDLGLGYDSIAPRKIKDHDTTWDFIGPFKSANGTHFYKIKNRYTGYCLIPQSYSSQTSGWRLGKVSCDDASSEIWTITEIPPEV
ncbi:hypothetical protein [Microbulbifer sp. PSTR4-B]|uniref:hypothetical protein n=1 Tax=Microbulbifer sp. PSTR4-B TaxID=3243396 RepID=UPI004039045E